MYLIAAPWKMPMLLYTLMFFQVNFSLDFKQFFKLLPLPSFVLIFHFIFIFMNVHMYVCVYVLSLVKFYMILYIESILCLPIKLNIFYFKC